MRCHITSIVWGDWHTRVFADLCLPSLVAPGNLPAFAGINDTVYAVYTTGRDAPRIKSSRAFARLSEIMETHLVIIEDQVFTATSTYVQRINIHVRSWQSAIAQARGEAASIVCIAADSMWADGSLARLGAILAERGKAVFAPNIRVSEEHFTPDVAALAPTAEDGAIALPPRTLTRLAAKHMQGLHASRFFDSPHRVYHHECFLLPVPGEGFVMRWTVTQVFAFDTMAFEGGKDIIISIGKQLDDIVYIEDSDDCFSVSLTPFLKDHDWFHENKIADPIDAGIFEAHFSSPSLNPLRQKSFRAKFGDITEAKWLAAEQSGHDFLTETWCARVAYRLWQSLVKKGHHQAARLIAVALATGILKELVGFGPVTFVLPGDEAFEMLDRDDLSDLCGKPEKLARFLSDHLVPGAVVLAKPGIPTLHGASRDQEIKATMHSGARKTFRSSDGRIKIGGTKVVEGPFFVEENPVYISAGILSGSWRGDKFPSSAVVTPSVQQLPMARVTPSASASPVVTLSDRRLPKVKAFREWPDHATFALGKARRNGLFCEFGVHAGYTLSTMAQILPDVTFHGFDSFLGLQEDWQNQGVGHLGMDGKPPDHLPDNVTLHVGFFDQTLPVFSEAHRENIAFMHVDCDLYSSTVTILDAVSDKIQPGTVIMFDEYYTDDKGGDEARAYDEFVKKTDRRFRYISRHLHGGSVAVIIT